MVATVQPRQAAHCANARSRRGWEAVCLPLIAWLAVPAEAPRWVVMWTLALALFFACKWATWRHRAIGPVAPWRATAYLLAWTGMDADAFLGGRGPRTPTVLEWSFAALKTLLGLILLYGVTGRALLTSTYFGGAVGMVGLVFFLHFGLFHVLSCGWRMMQVDAAPLMNWPIAATSVGDFWGRRWNTAFRDLTHRYIFRPLVPSLGAVGALLASFGASGLVHEVVITIPAVGGYGGPTLYFMLQAAGVLAERSAIGRQAGLGRGAWGRLFAAAVLLLPVGFLFPSPFILRVIVPFLEVIGAGI